MKGVQVDLGTVIALISVFVSAAIAAYAGLLKYTITKHDEDANRRFMKLEGDGKEYENEKRSLAERLRLDELETERVKGRVAVVEATQSGVNRVIEEMRQQQVPRAEWERQIKTIETQLATIMAQLSRMVPQGRGSAPSTHGE